MELNEIIAQRSAKLEVLRQKGIAPYPAFVPSHTEISQALVDFQEGRQVSLCGRIISKRLHGKVLFMDLRGSGDKIQLYFKEDFLGQENFALLENIDIADIINVQGELFKTHTGERTLKVEKFTLLAKTLRPLPEKWHGLKDVDTRYRQRYLDLISNPQVKKIFLMRSRIIQAVRRFLDNKGFLEVETPMMHYIPGGAAGRPFKTYHHEYNLELYLRIAPELYLKRLLVAGLDRVYEINRNFRNEGVSTKHNPEFTMLEVYAAYANYEEMMHLCAEMITAVAQEVLGKTTFVYQGKSVDLALPWQRRSFASLLKEKFGIEPDDQSEVVLKKLQSQGYALDKPKLSRSQVNKVIEDILEEGLNMNPTFITDYFSHLCPLAKNKKDEPLISERFEVYIGGIEIGNAYSELNDPQQQRSRLQEEIRELESAEKKEVDEDFLLALEHGMPPAAGLGIGMDRLVMLLTDQPSIRDVILFPLLRPIEAV